MALMIFGITHSLQFTAIFPLFNFGLSLVLFIISIFMLKPIVLHKTNLSGFIVFIIDMIFLFFNGKIIVFHANLYSNSFYLADQKAESNVYIIYNVFIWGLSGMILNFINI